MLYTFFEAIFLYRRATRLTNDRNAYPAYRGVTLVVLVAAAGAVLGGVFYKKAGSGAAPPCGGADDRQLHETRLDSVSQGEKAGFLYWPEVMDAIVVKGTSKLMVERHRRKN